MLGEELSVPHPTAVVTFGAGGHSHHAIEGSFDAALYERKERREEYEGFQPWS